MTMETSHTPHCNLVKMEVICDSSVFNQGSPVPNMNLIQRKIRKILRYYCGCIGNLVSTAMWCSKLTPLP